MDMRVYDVYIDGVRLPPWFLRDSETQLGVRSNFTFDGHVARWQPEDGSPVADDLFMPPGPPIGQLRGNTVSFRLRRSSTEAGGADVAVRIGSAGANLQFRMQGDREYPDTFGAQQTWWELDWGETYELFTDFFSPPNSSRMTVMVRRCRRPFADVSSEFNRPNAL